MQSVTQNIDLLITGKVRDAQVSQMAIACLLPLIRSRFFRRAIFSGWNDDLLKFPEFFRFLQSENIIFVNCGDGLAVRSQWNYWEQIKTLDCGLMQIEDGVYVFKTRCDLIIPNGEDFLPAFLTSKIGVVADCYGLKYKIWIPSFVPAQPFFMADQCYMGSAEDLRRFLIYDASYEASGTSIPFYPGSTSHPSAAATETRFWISPFLNAFPILREYLYVLPFSMNGFDFYKKIEDFQFDSSIYLEYVSLYWHIVSRTFQISALPFVLGHSIEESGRVTYRAKSHDFAADNFIEDVLSRHKIFPISVSDDAGFHRFLAGRIESDFYRAFQQALSRALNHAHTPSRRAAFLHYLSRLSEVAHIHNLGR
jgi:hypothetical protein